jgi:hypothetical protein
VRGRRSRSITPAAADREGSLGDAPAPARRARIGSLDDRQWTVIASCREEAARTGQPPGPQRLEVLTGLDAEELKRLVPGDVEALVARIAGLT